MYLLTWYMLSFVVMYEPGGQEEPPYQYVPESPLSEMQKGVGALEQSMLLLADGLASGALVAQFEQLYRKKPGLSSNEAKKQENINKNRYRDISPCTFKYYIDENYLLFFDFI